MHSLADRVAGYFTRPFDSSLLRDDGSPVSVVTSFVTEGFFDVIGLPMTRGRSFTREEHVPAGRTHRCLSSSPTRRGHDCSGGTQASLARPSESPNCR
jgi:hypothetical protein